MAEKVTKDQNSKFRRKAGFTDQTPLLSETFILLQALGFPIHGSITSVLVFTRAWAIYVCPCTSSYKARQLRLNNA